ncbi:MAG: SoxR reducing system RseC family protein [Oscillospiraceae bacterium]|nr:SoxR reducing system RseC family protein [Oscillospiraceae bacterium]
MEQVVRVQKCEPDGTAQVLHTRQSACSGDCHQCAGCGAVQEKMLLTVRNPIGAQPGDMVVIRSDSGPVLAAAAILYLLPLVLFFVGYGVFAILGGNGALGGCLAFVLGLIGAQLYDRLVVKKKKTVYTIIGYKRG